MTTYAGAIPVTSVTCPPWCTVTQQEHLEQLSNVLNGGDVTHEHVAGMVTLVHSTYPDGSVHADEPGPMVALPEAYLTVEEARATLGDLQRAVDMTEPLNHEAFRAITETLETTLEEVAAAAGVDLGTATRADSWRLTRELAGMLSDGRPARRPNPEPRTP